MIPAQQLDGHWPIYIAIHGGQATSWILDKISDQRGAYIMCMIFYLNDPNTQWLIQIIIGGGARLLIFGCLFIDSSAEY